MPRRSVLIGVQSYDGDKGLGALTCPLADVALMERIFADARYVGERASATVLRDPAYAEATASLGAFLRQLERDDACLFYFSGHGMRDANGDLFLCFRDSDERDLELSALNIKRLRAVFEARHLRRVLVVLDCCYSGAAGAPLTKDSLGSKLNEVEEARPDGTGLYVLSSAGAAETAKEGAGHSVFTHHFVRGIETGEADRDGTGEITVQDIAQYVVAKVPEDAPGQKPLLSSRSVAGTFTVALNEAALRARQTESLARARSEIFEAASERLIAAHGAKDVSRAFMLEVLGWIDATPEADPALPPMPLLADYGARRAGLDEFVRGWNARREATMAPPDAPDLIASQEAPTEPEAAPEDRAVERRTREGPARPTPPPNREAPVGKGRVPDASMTTAGSIMTIVGGLLCSGVVVAATRLTYPGIAAVVGINSPETAVVIQVLVFALALMVYSGVMGFMIRRASGRRLMLNACVMGVIAAALFFGISVSAQQSNPLYFMVIWTLAVCLAPLAALLTFRLRRR